jgi:hypothetical protein
MISPRVIYEKSLHYRNIHILLSCDSESFSHIKEHVSWLETRETHFQPDVILHLQLNRSLEHKASYPLKVKHIEGNRYSIRRDDLEGEGLHQNGKPLVFRFKISTWIPSLWAVLNIAYSSAVPFKNALVLHASSIQFGNKGVLFLGLPESGKTTAADKAALLLPDCRKINDDLTEIQFYFRDEEFVTATVNAHFLLTEKFRPKEDVSIPVGELNWIKGWNKDSRKLLNLANSIGMLGKSLITPVISRQLADRMLELVLVLAKNYKMHEMEIKDFNALKEWFPSTEMPHHQ